MKPDDVLERLSRANPVPGDLHAPAIEPLLDRLEQPRPSGRAASGGLGRRRSSLGAFAAVALSAVVVAVVVGALVSLRSHKPAPRPAPVPAAAVPGRQQLIEILGVLRRPQTSADLHLPSVQRVLRQRPPGPAMLGEPDVPLIRRLGATPWDSAVVLIPMRPPTAAWLAALRRRYPGLPERFFQRPPSRPTRTQEGIFLGVDTGGSCCTTAADIEAQGMLETDGAGRSFAGGSTQTRLTVVVPDGVAKVAFVLPRQSSGNLYGAPVYRNSLTVTVPVHNNFAAVQVARECCASGPLMIWYAADGHVIKRIGNFASVNRVVAVPTPGPETPLSRAAERNPSAPNRVWITPSVGGPHTNFMVHFRVLLNGADYSYHFAGTPCPQFTFPGGTGQPNALRGDLWSDPIGAVERQALCPGTYQIAVTVMDLGRYGELKQPAQPFGRATFTVR